MRGGKSNPCQAHVAFVWARCLCCVLRFYRAVYVAQRPRPCLSQPVGVNGSLDLFLSNASRDYTSYFLAKQVYNSTASMYGGSSLITVGCSLNIGCTIEINTVYHALLKTCCSSARKNVVAMVAIGLPRRLGGRRARARACTAAAATATVTATAGVPAAAAVPAQLRRYFVTRH